MELDIETRVFITKKPSVGRNMKIFTLLPYASNMERVRFFLDSKDFFKLKSM